MTNYHDKVDKVINLLKEAINECEDIISHDHEKELFYERMDRDNMYDIINRLKPINDIIDYDSSPDFPIHISDEEN